MGDSSQEGHPRPEIWKMWAWQIIGRPYHLISQMESVRPLIVPGSFLLGSFTPPNGGFSNPGVWIMLWTQLTARLVQYWSFQAGAATTTLRDYVTAIAA